ncbi:uncharacterized protein [Paramisgurnus dabryanus]|uniref:uncharacterized protein isoform X1 n=1 Tax=Paramisgurnus dabryanus TaxID=90735 RepID=UPI0031F41382
MMTSAEDLLCDALKKLQEEKLKRFKIFLKQDGSIPATEHDDVPGTVEKMIDCVGPEQAVKITLDILMKMDQNYLSEELEKKHKKVQNTSDEISSRPHTGAIVDVDAKTGASVNAPVLTGNTFTGPVNFSLNAAGTEAQQFAEQQTSDKQELALQTFLNTHKINMKEKAEHIFEGRKENEALLRDVYTELYITEGDIKEVNREHEILKIDDAFKTKKSQDRQIDCSEIFRLLRKNKKIVLTKGIAGIGKTVSVHKLILDWAEGKANQEIHCMFLLSFREINLMKNEEFNLHEFLLEFYPELNGLEKTKFYETHNLVFIFDGLDESQLALKFESRTLKVVDKKSSVDLLFTSLVKGDLLPSALVWVTSRPAAANQIPPEFVGLYTEVRGFTDQQKEEYFRKRISDESQASRIISHIKTSRSLYIMCHIPVFCWITATVLLEILFKNNGEHIPTTLTEMYVHFLLIQMTLKNQKFDETVERNYKKLLDANLTNILKLAKLAFKQLKKEKTVFFEEDLKECGIDASDDCEQTGMFTEILKKEAGIYEMKVFCFVHLSIQEFLAALYVFFCYLNKNLEELQFFFENSKRKSINEFSFHFKKMLNKVKLHELLKRAIAKAMQNERGHLDLFLRFLLGISLESNRKMLSGLFACNKDTTKSITKVIKHIKQLQDKDLPAETSINLFFCLVEVKDHSLFKEVQRYLSSNTRRELSYSMCSVLAYILLMSEEVLDEFNLKMYKTSTAGYMRLVPVVRCCRKALFDNGGLTETCCEIVKLALQLPNSPLIELDLSFNSLHDSGVKLLSDGLQSPNCQLNILRLSGSRLTCQCCESLASVLQSSNSSLRELDLSNNDLQDLGIKLLSDGLKSPNCQLEILRLALCNLSGQCCESLSSALQSSDSCLRELDLSNNDLHDSGVQLIYDGLKSPNCQLKKLSLAGCNLTGQHCESLASVLQSSNFSLRKLDLSNNDLQDSGVKLLSDGLKSSNCQLEILRLAMCSLNTQHCESLASVLQSSNSSLKELDLMNNDLQDSGVKLLSDGLKSPNCQLEILRLSGCMVTEEGCGYLASALSSNQSHLKELDLSYNHTGPSGDQILSERLNEPNCTLKKLNVDHDGKFRITAGLKKYACNLTLDPNTIHTHLKLFEENQKVTYMDKEQSYPDHPDRFDVWHQVLSRERLIGRCYWEAEWSGKGVYISLSYKEIKRKGWDDEGKFGVGADSWTLICSDNRFTARHNNNFTYIPIYSPPSNKVGVYVDWPNGTLSFYSVSDTNTLTHLITFNSTFTEPLYAGLRVFDDSSASLTWFEL